MKKALCITRNTLAVLSLLALVVAASADAGDTLVRFKGGIGVIPTSRVDAGPPIVVSPNTVRGVNAAGQIWVIADLRANVKVDGRIRVDGRGLLLGGGNNIGGNANARVIATLICEAAAPFVQHSTAPLGVALDPDGDFRIDDVLTPAPPPVCASPVLLIRNAANLGWFAAGIPER